MQEDEKLIVVRTVQELKDLERYLQTQDFVAFDTETNGVEKGSKIIGISVAAEVNVAYYVVLSYWDVEKKKLVDLETAENIKPILRILAEKNLIMHNAVFDCWMVNNNYNIDLMPSVHTDTMILGHLLNENRSNGLKERGVELYGEDARAEQAAMKESVTKNGGELTKNNFELYKADADLIAFYGAKDALLTLKIFYHDVEILFEEGLDKFFYEDESMPLLRGPTYQLNTVGLRVDPHKLQELKATLEAECAEAKAFIEKEIYPYVIKKYPATGKKNHFNINATQQLAWLLFFELGNDFTTLTKNGKLLCKYFDLPLPYSNAAKRAFIQAVEENKGKEWKEGNFNKRTGKRARPMKVGDPWQYLTCGKDTLTRLSKKYKWVEKLLEYKKNTKLLSTYVEGIQSRARYNIIRPSFLQHGTTSGRYSSKNPNFQNLPREDKRIKSCLIARPNMIFVGADYSQLEPRVFASLSKDERLINCFKNNEDFYSVTGIPIFGRYECSTHKDDKNAFAKLFPEERQISKNCSLAATYGVTAPRLSSMTGKSLDESRDTLHKYFEEFPSVREMMLSAHEEAKRTGVVKNLFGRPRRMPEAKYITELFGNASHEELPYEYRNILNLSMNHKVQSTGASIMNRAAIAFYKSCRERAQEDGAWMDVAIVMQVHDELIVEGPERLKDAMVQLLKHCMEKTTVLPRVDLVAEPKAAHNLAELK